MGFWDRKKVLVTGGAGFLGSHLVEQTLAAGRGVRVTVADDLSNGTLKNLSAVKKDIRFLRGDLMDFDACAKACRGQDIVLCAAARVAGVGFNSAHQGTMFRDNMRLSLNMIEAARQARVERFLAVSSACVYSRDAAVPTPESAGFEGSPESSNEGYGWAKRMTEVLAQAYQKEFGLKFAIARPFNTYGPRDHFDSPDSHVIAALTRRIVGGENPVLVWGDGSVTRSFIYVEDFARGLLEVAEKCADADPINLGSDEEVTIRDLAGDMLKLSGSKAKLVFDPSKPAGQPRRACDTSKAKLNAGFTARISLREGLRRTIDWYRESLGKRRNRK